MHETGCDEEERVQHAKELIYAYKQSHILTRQIVRSVTLLTEGGGKLVRPCRVSLTT